MGREARNPPPKLLDEGLLAPPLLSSLAVWAELQFLLPRTKTSALEPDLFTAWTSDNLMTIHYLWPSSSSP